MCLPHDWLTWRLSGGRDLADLVTDRSDASGTGYWSAATGDYRTDLLERALGARPAAAAGARPGRDGCGTHLGGRAPRPRHRRQRGGRPRPRRRARATSSLSIGTSGVVTRRRRPARAPTPRGLVAGFADATGRFLPLVCTLNAARVLDAVARMLGVDHDRLSELALDARRRAPTAWSWCPYLEGERTPNLPDATGALHGLTPGHRDARPTSPAPPSKGCCAASPTGSTPWSRTGVEPRRVLLVGGGAALRGRAPDRPDRARAARSRCPQPGEYVADGAARQAAWVAAASEEPPTWELAGAATFDAPAQPKVRAAYAAACRTGAAGR